MQILRYFIGLNTVSLRIYTLIFIGCAGGLCGASVLAPSRRRRGGGQHRSSAQPANQAWLRPDVGGVEVKPDSRVGRDGVLFFPARCVGFAGWKRSERTKPIPLRRTT